MSPKERERSPSRRKRTDAVQNLDRILQASSKVFAEMGVDAQMNDVAQAAEVGIATLYRNFPTKEALVQTLLIQHLSRLIEVAQTAVKEPDAWEALARFFQWTTTLQMENRILSQFLGARIVGSSAELAAKRNELADILGEVCQRAVEAGQMRTDVNPVDVFAGLRAVAQVSSSDLHPRLVRRLASIILDGLQAPGRRTLEGPPVTNEELDEYEAPLMRRSDGSAQQAPFRRGRRTWPTSR